MLAATPTENDAEQKSCTVMALLDGGMLRRHKSWLKVRHPLAMVFCRVVVTGIYANCYFSYQSIFS